METNKVYNIDCIKGMQQKIPNGSIDLVVTSPPYDKIRDYQNNWDLNLTDVGNEISRVLKEGGVAVMVIQDQTVNGEKTLTSFKTIVDWVENTNLGLFETCIYKRHGTPGAWWKKRFRVDHEYVPIFIKGKSPQYFDKDHMKVRCVQAGITKVSGGHRKTNGETSDNKEITYKDTKCPGTIWDYSAEKNSRKEKIKYEHPATFPDQFAEDMIKCFTDRNMVVLDPMCGSGTVGKMAKKFDRNYVLMDVSKEYCKLSRKRINRTFRNIFW